MITPISEGKSIIYGLNNLYRQIAKGFAEDTKSDPELSSKIKNMWLYGSVAANKPNPSDIDIYIEAERWLNSDMPKLLNYMDKWEANLRDRLISENPKAFESGYLIEFNIEINKPLLWEQVTKWHKPRMKL